LIEPPDRRQETGGGSGAELLPVTPGQVLVEVAVPGRQKIEMFELIQPTGQGQQIPAIGFQRVVTQTFFQPAGVQILVDQVLGFLE